MFTLETPDGMFDGEGTNFEIENFAGNLALNNNSFLFTGSASTISFGKNKLLLNGKTFTLTSTKKTTVDLFFSELSLIFNKGRVKLSDDLNYEFTNTTVLAKDFNVSVSYDGTFSFTGPTKSFSLSNPSQGLEINYVKN